MVSLLEAKNNVSLIVKSVGENWWDASPGRGRHGRGRRMGGGNWCRRFSNMGIREGVIIKKISMHPFFGPVVIRFGGCEVAIGRRIASTILVEEVDE